MSLVSSADEKILPQLQLIDDETLQWIKQNKPNFKSSYIVNNYLKTIKTAVIDFFPPRSWFLKKESVDSIHGIRHITRVVANTSYLIQENKITDRRLINNLLVSASLHDLRRKDDKNDMGHAQRVVNWLNINKNKVLNQYHLNLDCDDFKAISSVVLLHELPYNQFKNKARYNESIRIMVDLLKSADALDRYRLPKLSWWIDDKYLVLLPSAGAKKFAYTMVVMSEDNYLKTQKSEESILVTLDAIRKKI